jgi:hypothetical protein
MMTPTIHLNGTSRDELVSQYVAALDALHNAMQALIKMAPNGRDYYPQGDDAFPQARREQIARLSKLDDLYKEIEGMALRIAHPELITGE